ncbi:MAG: peptide chain release factor N(5)-glutamine methyltransferase [Candidatus Kapaibacterium sp.]
MSEQKLKSLLEILNYSSGYLNDNSIENPRLNAELMLADIMNCKRLQLYLDFEKPLSSDEKEKLKGYLRRRVKREPLQYILGKTNFFGYDIFLNNHVLIPRQETEILTEKVLNDIYTSGKEKINVFELGVGSGCIAVAILSELEKRGIECSYHGIDISEEAISAAKKNLDFYKLKNYSLEVQNFTAEDYEIKEGFDYVVSNPPYVPIEDYKKLMPEVNMYEPDYAVTDFKDGTRFYRKLLKSYKSRNSKYFLEIAYNAKDKLEDILREEGISNYTFEKDYSNNYRVLIIRK